MSLEYESATTPTAKRAKRQPRQKFHGYSTPADRLPIDVNEMLQLELEDWAGRKSQISNLE